MNPRLGSAGGTAILNRKGYLFEPKLDGLRALVIKNKRVKILNRHGKDITSKYKNIPISASFSKPCIVDGEFIVYDKKGNPHFSSMMHYYTGSKEFVPTFVVFDVLAVNGKSLESKPLLERKKILHKMFRPTKNVQLMIYTTDGEKLWKLIRKRDAEGVVAKKNNSLY